MDSFGYLYGRITKALGFRANRHEGKVLGLAAAGSSSEALNELRDIITVENGQMSFKLGGIYAPFYDRHFDGMEMFAAQYSKEDIAYAVQTVLIEALTKLIKYYLHNTGHKNIAAAGGVFTTRTP